ncbi:advanced glycosylation end product-specific receptor [Cynoglossus semilaevis]|uniref:Advanced glycosylation end product-specific receptor-like n=1 Tax=Cynoglossus semilaevis TaxID=244447 RepID=A0A3P8WD57_CYNSE|nr:advanced glycosylation end product-specific receptor-like [Cynoglossus semilaevis]
MKILIVIALAVLIQENHATLVIKGPTKSVVAGESVEIECLYTDSEFNISQVRFEFSYDEGSIWFEVYERSTFCALVVYRTSERLVLRLRAYSYRMSMYRCVSEAENVTAPNNASEPWALKVEFMSDLTLSKEGYTKYLGIPKELSVRPGDDVVLTCSARSSEEPSYFWNKEGSDWNLPSATMMLRKVSKADEGQYSCTAQHPLVESLSKKSSVKIIVLEEDAPWYQSTDGRLILMTSASVAALLVLLLSMTVFLCRRAKRARTIKGPIDDHSQKKPIYKSSSESLPSSCEDKHPLV